MKKKFSSYFNKISDETIEKMLKNGLISFDSNILLDLYFKSDENVEIFFKISEHSTIKPRIKLPYHITKELFNNRNRIVLVKINIFNEQMEKAKERLKNFKKEICQNLIPICYKENLNETNIEKFNENIEKMIKFVDSKDFLKDRNKIYSDYIFEKINKLFNNKTGKNLNSKNLNIILNEGKNRYFINVPPGFKDYKKPKNKYGDLIVWEELIKFSKESKKDMIFVTNDNKKDWKISLPDGKLVPHHELLCEFKEKTDGQKIYFLEYDEFINKMGKILEIKIKKQKNEHIILNLNSEKIYKLTLLKNDLRDIYLNSENILKENYINSINIILDDLKSLNYYFKDFNLHNDIKKTYSIVNSLLYEFKIFKSIEDEDYIIEKTKSSIIKIIYDINRIIYKKKNK
ncbi:hypothetical protein MARBORIA2_11720 [Methanobrevibacter arboriphilus]|uniref:PIN-like domain-containing protein n=1 Tax=Methanobrevibacter arboriphilus TaxID=39441 RepID=UPI0022EDC182|nr:PIN-like domain-containing protein [Methanobrevibacter arboriphilus]GLI12082.1 hypothetical protein MARBORIA2_11720 [Methanobrevibacter arboriphilus]